MTFLLIEASHVGRETVPVSVSGVAREGHGISINERETAGDDDGSTGRMQWPPGVVSLAESQIDVETWSRLPRSFSTSPLPAFTRPSLTLRLHTPLQDGRRVSRRDNAFFNLMDMFRTSVASTWAS